VNPHHDRQSLSDRFRSPDVQIQAVLSALTGIAQQGSEGFRIRRLWRHLAAGQRVAYTRPWFRRLGWLKAVPSKRRRCEGKAVEGCDPTSHPPLHPTGLRFDHDAVRDGAQFRFTSLLVSTPPQAV